MFKRWLECVCAVFFTFGLNAANIDSHFDKAPLAFEPNRGQWGPRTGFGVHGQGFVAGFSGRDVEFSLKGKSAANVRMRWQGGNGGVHIAPAEDLGGVSNYYRGSDSSKWISKVPHYRKLRVDGLYPGINLIYYGQGRELEYDLEVAPGADPRKARLQFDGANSLRLDEHGDLMIETAAGNLVQHKPVAYQVSDGQRVAVAANYRLRGRNQVSIEVGQFDRTRPLVVDPTIAWGQSFQTTYGGGATGVAVDGSGSVYLTGSTASPDFPLVNPVDNTLGCPSFCEPDAFIMKLSPDGETVLFSTFLGGSAEDSSQAVALDGAGNVYIAGLTLSPDFPTKSPHQAALNGRENAFLAKFTTSGTLTYATYLGGSELDVANALATDTAGNVYLTGYTSSSDFPTAGAYQSTLAGGEDAFVTKVSSDGSTLIFSTYLGGSGTDVGNAIALGSGGTVYVAGETYSTNFPTKNAVQGSSLAFGLDSAFVAQLDSTGAALVYSTYLGGFGGAAATGIDVDATGAAYIVGTAGMEFPSKNSMQAFGGNNDAFITKLSPDGSSLVYSTYLGGSQQDLGLAVKVNSSLNAIVVGTTSSLDFPTLAALDPKLNSQDGFVAQLNAAGSALVFSTYLGGSATDTAAAVATDAGGAIYVAGQTSSGDFPIQLQESQGAGFVVKLSGGTTSIAATVNSIPPGLSLIVDGTTVTTPRTFQWAPGVSHQLSAPALIGPAGPDVTNFVSWSNGGAETQSVITPAAATTYTATYSTQACVYSFSAGSQTVGQAGSSGNFSVNTPAGCPWTATASAPWLTGAFQGTGPGNIQYEVAANTGGGTRTGTITLGSATFTITQESMTPTVSYALPCCGQSLSGASQTFQVRFSDADGVTDLSVSNILINNFLDGRQACYLALDHQAKVLYLVGDSGGGLTGMSFDGNGQGSGVISNSQCAVDGTKTFISQQGTTATLTLGLDFTPSFGGNKVIYLAARDMEGNNSGWVPSGTWGVPAVVVYPEVVSGSSGNTSQTDTFSVSVTYRDATNNSNLSPVQILINDYLNGANACYFGYDHTDNLLYLLNDAGSALLPAITPGVGTATQQNSQCVVYAQNSTVQQNGTDLTLNLNLFFLPGFRGHRIVYAATQTITNGNSGWQAIGAIDIQ